MRSKASYFSVSLPLLKENMRRFWAIPVLAFLVYFLSGVFPILMSYKGLNFMAPYIELSLHNMQPFFMGAHLLVPVITAVLLFRYLQNVSSVAVMHSMPFTRSKLYNSNFISGLILISLPIIVNGVIMLLISKPTYRQWGYGDEITISTINVFSRGEIFNWMGTSLLIVIVLFSVAVFAGVISGNNLMHLLTSYFFIFLIPLLYAVFNFYFQEFLYGFDLSGNWVDIALSISPYTGILNSGGYFSILEVLYYTGTILLMLVISAVLYNIRRLERASDSLTFNFMKPIICYVIAFLGMTMLGFYFQVLGEGRIYMYAGFAAGTVIFFIIGQMIVVKSPRIYNKEGLKSFLAYALIAVLFIAGLNFDLTGFEKRVPKPQNIKTAHISMPFSSSMRSNVGFDVEALTSKENVEALAKFHREILNNRHRFEEAENLYTSSLKINYDMKGLFDMSRRYEIDYNFWADSRELKEIFESAEYKEKNSLHTSKIEKFEKAYIYSEVSDDKNIEINNSRLLDELIANIEKDFQEMSYEDLVSPRPTYINIEFQYTYKVGERSDWGDGKGYISLGIWENAKNTIDWLRARNYGIELTADMVEWIDVYAPKYESGNNMAREKSMAMSEYDYSVKVEERPAIMQIKDKDKIEKILKTYDRFSINSDTSYEVSIAYKMNGSDYHYTNGYLNRTLDFLN